MKNLNNKILYLTTGTLLLGFVLYFAYTQQKPENNENDLENVREVVSVSDNNESEEYHPELSIQAFSQKEFDGRDLELGPVLDSNSAYTRYYITYKSGELTISGIMNVPTGEGPFPLLILNHGYIDPAVYTNGRGLKREQDYFARNGYVVIHPDYRNHADSSKVEDVSGDFRFGYTEDVINAVYAAKESSLDFIDTEKIGMLGHSMGGGITLNVITAHPDLVDAASLYAPVSSEAYDNFERWTQGDVEIAERIISEYGTKEENPKFWQNISPMNFLDNVTAPVVLHHGTADASCPIEWSDKLALALEDSGKDIDYHVYKGAPHEFIGSWGLFMQRNLEFFNNNL